MRKTGDKCGFTQVYASLIAAFFMTASSASFLPVIAGVIVGRTLGWTAKRPQQHLPDNPNDGAMRASRQSPAVSSDEPPSFSEDNLFEGDGWEGEAGVADWEPFRQLGRSMANYIANYYEQIEKRPVGARVEPGYLERAVESTEFPAKGEKWTDIMADVESVVMPGIVHWQHPRFFGYFPAGSSAPAVLADMLANMFNVIGFSWDSSPAATELEVLVLDQLARAVGLPQVFSSKGEGGGAIQASATDSTLFAMLSAKTRALKHMRRMNPELDDHDLVGKMTLYCCDQAHSSVQKAAKAAGLLTNMRLIPGRAKGGANDQTAFGMDLADLKAAMEEDLAAGLTPVFVNANCGTTNSCAIDPIPAIGELCRSFKVRRQKAAEGLVPWLHIDAAYAGSASLCPENRWMLKGVENADSMAFSLHKWLLMNIDCCAMWVKKRADLIETLSVRETILVSEDRGQPDFKDWQVSTGRKFRSLKIWLTMRAFGLDKLKEHIRGGQRLAQEFEKMVKTDERFEIIAPQRCGLVCFRLKSSDEANEELRARIIASGYAFFSTTCLEGQTVLRMCVGNPKTTFRHVEEVWHALTQTTDGMEADGF